MYVTLIALTILAAILLIGVVLIQKSKGGGLSSSFAGSNQIMGVRRTNNFIEKVTWSLAGAIAFFAILCAWISPDAIRRPKVTAPVQQEAVAGTQFDGAAAAAEQAPVAAPEAHAEGE